ncbi:MAG: hypothetical protein AB8B94_16695 [Hyphomicrobiales bacterium]
MEIEADTAELETLVRMLLHGQITENDVENAKQREFNYQSLERSARVSKLFVEAHERSQQKS